MSRPLTVAIAALYTDSVSGLGTYTRELLAAVAARDDAHRYVVFLPHGAAAHRFAIRRADRVITI